MVLAGGASTRISAIGPDGSRVATKDGSTTAYLVSDLHGNVAAAEASGTPAIADALRYDGYGQTLATYTATGSITLDTKYQGRLDLSASATDSLYDAGARLYSPGIGTFTSLDSWPGSAASPISMNRFLYAEANPTTLIDPTGHWQAEHDEDPGCRNPGDSACGRTTTAATPKVWKAAPPRIRCSSRGCVGPAQKSVPSKTQVPPKTVAPERQIDLPATGQPGSQSPPVDVNAGNTPGGLNAAGGPCLSSSIGFGTLLSSQACLSFDLDDFWNGDAALVITSGLQSSSGAGANISVGGFGSNARTPDDYVGPFADLGASLGEGEVGGANVALGQAKDGYIVGTLDVSYGTGVGFSPGIPGYIYGGAVESRVIRFNPADLPLPFVNPWALYHGLDSLLGGG